MRAVMRAVATLIAALVAALLPAANPSTASESSCAPRDAKVLVASADVQVFRDRAKDNALFACTTRTSKSYLLDDPTADVHAFPSVAVRGRYVAWAVNVPSDTDITTTVNVADGNKFGAADPAAAIVRNDAANYGSRESSAKVGRIVLGRRGDVAWTTCPTTDPSSPTATPKPNCLRPGARDRVWKLVGDSRRPRALATGRRLDPQSLRLSGNTLTWINAGRRERTRLAR
jgi:hypothetical protein